MLKHCLYLFLLFFGPLSAELIATFYRDVEIEEPVLLELLHSPALERLKHLHQYGVSYYNNSYPEEYTRYAHSLGVFAILRAKNASLEEQIAGLLHDISHTAFSHVGDWVFGKEHQENDHQSTVHDLYLKTSGIEEILQRHGYTVSQVSPKRKEFQMLEQPLPTLCADRIDYNIQGAYFQNWITQDQAKQIVQDLTFEGGHWFFTEIELAAQLTRFSLFMTENCWGSASNWLASRWLADAILRGFKIGLLSEIQFQRATDQEIWDRLEASKDPLIQQRLQRVRSPELYYQPIDASQTPLFLPFRCRGINPWIKREGKLVRLTSIQPELEQLFQKVHALSLQGWPVQLLSPE
jgi:uncharacterized protein